VACSLMLAAWGLTLAACTLSSLELEACSLRLRDGMHDDGPSSRRGSVVIRIYCWRCLSRPFWISYHFVEALGLRSAESLPFARWKLLPGVPSLWMPMSLGPTSSPASVRACVKKPILMMIGSNPRLSPF
jgi:hypothetical protein